MSCGRTPAARAAAAVAALAATLAAALVPAGCESAPPAWTSDPAVLGRVLPPAPQRPRDPWVFRSVLDQQPRILTLALSDDLWAAYDTATCSLFKVWHGGVPFAGPVYTTMHGPQPTSAGKAYPASYQDAHWFMIRKATAGVPAADEVVPVQATWVGHGFSDGHVDLEYSLMTNGGEVVGSVVETPEACRVVDPRPMAFVRRFSISQAPAASAFVLTAGDTPESESLSREVWAEQPAYGRELSWITTHSHRGGSCVWLNPDGQTLLPDRYTVASEVATPADAALSTPEPLAAERSADSASAETFEGDGLSAVDEPGAPTLTLDPVALTVPTEPGVCVRLYDIGEELDRLMPLVAGQTPNIDRVVPQLDLRGERGDFAPLEEEFLTVATGFLRVDRPGRTAFRLVSDDGSQLELGGQLLIDHDGLHAAGPKDAAAELSAGSYPFTVRHFEYGGGEQLTLLWRPPGAARFDVVPDAVLSCQAGEVRVTSPGPKKVIRPLPRGRPGDGQPLAALHPSFDLATVRPEGFQPRVGGMDFLPDGRLVISTWDADGSVWILDGVQGDDPAAIHARRFAAGLAEPLGLKVVGGRIFVMQKQELTELIDQDGDGTADEHRCVCNAWPVTANFHEFGFGLAEQDGWLYANLAIAIAPGGRSTHPQIEGRGSVVRIDPATGRCETVANGLRAPNGIGLGVGGDIFVTDNQGDWLPSSKLLALQPGAFYGNRSVLEAAADALPVTPPVLWLPQGEIGNSPSQPARLDIGPWRGQMIHGDVTHGGLKRDVIETVDGVTQGCVIDFCQGLEAGVNRLAWGPDGALYVGGIGSTGNWGQEGKQRFGLQRLRFNGHATFEPLAVRARSNGFEIEFTEPIAADDDRTAWDPDAWIADQWRYEPTDDYGGEKLDLTELPVRSVSVLDGGRLVFLEIDGLHAGHVVHLRAPNALRSTSGQSLWTTEAWYTLNRIPRDLPGSVLPPPTRRAPNTLSDAERSAGWRLLFDGSTTRGWHAFGKPGTPAGFTVADGALGRTAPSGDIATDEEFGDFELALDWRIGEGGNSGIMVRVTEDHGAPWETGPEMQVLDNQRHHDGRDPVTSAGSCYALYAPDADDTRPVGRWNHARIRVQGHHVEHWLNGVLQCRYELQSPDWAARVAASKFAAMPDYGTRARGRIVLQDHGDRVSFRDIRIREL